MKFYMRFLINVMDIHGVRHQKSRHMCLARLIAMGIGC